VANTTSGSTRSSPTPPTFSRRIPKERRGTGSALARWLLLADHPLTSRTTVNRFWQEVFGVGLVTSSDDFGVIGRASSHPELLDWLAVEFRETGWNVKRLFKLDGDQSATYRQSAGHDAEKLAKDNANRLLSARARASGWMRRWSVTTRSRPVGSSSARSAARA
jgi:hypothetical protein